MPKEIADYLNKMGARIPNIKPGKATIEYLTKIQASTRFWGILPWHILLTKILFMNPFFFLLCMGCFSFFSTLFFYGGNYAGGLMLSILATTSTIADHYLRHINEGFSIGFTSVLIIVSSLLLLAFLLCMCLNHFPVLSNNSLNRLL